MTTEMVGKKYRLVLDTNVIISSILFGGSPKQLIDKITSRGISVYTSSKLIAELVEVLRKKFYFSEEKVVKIENEIIEKFEIVYPSKNIKVARDVDDNMVIEAAVEGKCNYIISRDKDLTDLKKYKDIKILNPKEFLDLIE